MVVKNKSKQVVLLRLSSGREVNVAPGKELPVSESELRSNPALKKLEQRGVLEVVGARPAAGGGS